MRSLAGLVLSAVAAAAGADCLERAREDAERLAVAGLLRADARQAAAELLAEHCRTGGGDDAPQSARVLGIEVRRAADDSGGHARLTKRR